MMISAIKGTIHFLQKHLHYVQWYILHLKKQTNKPETVGVECIRVLSKYPTVDLLSNQNSENSPLNVPENFQASLQLRPLVVVLGFTNYKKNLHFSKVLKNRGRIGWSDRTKTKNLPK